MFKEGNEVKWTENVQQTQQAGPRAPNYWVTTSGRLCWGERPRLRQPVPCDQLLQPRTAVRVRPGQQLLPFRCGNRRRPSFVVWPGCLWGEGEHAWAWR